MNWTTEPWLVIDTETTGVDTEAAEIVELAGVTFRAGQPAVRRSMLLRPSAPIPEEAIAIHGITNEMVAGPPPLTRVAPRFCAVVAQHEVLVAYNAPYDFRILARTCPGWSEAAEGRVILDPLALVRLDAVGRFWKGKGRHKLTAVYERYFGEVPVNAHRATADCLMAGRVLWQLRQHLPEDGREAMELLQHAQRQQEADYQAWKARQA